MNTQLIASEPHRSSRRGSLSGSHRSRTRLIQILGVTLALSLVINLLIAIALASYVRKASLLSGVGSSLRLELTGFNEQSELKTGQIKTLKNEIKELTLNRLPGLIRLSYDKVLKVDEQYVRNIVFTRTGKNGAHLYEYKVVLENHDAALQPALKVILFNRSGVQVGMSELSNKIEQGGITRLDQDEVRSHYAIVQLPDKAEPEYFQVILL
ncbi:MAG: hypothetical protein AB9Q22_01640 [Candidatus Reddybacter sp.]